MGGTSSTAVANSVVDLHRDVSGTWTCVISSVPTGYKTSYTPDGCTKS
ncbi:pilin [Mangrovitalea sediminis]